MAEHDGAKAIPKYYSKKKLDSLVTRKARFRARYEKKKRLVTVSVKSSADDEDESGEELERVTISGQGF